MTSTNRILYLAQTENVHHKRIIGALARTYDLVVLYGAAEIAEYFGGNEHDSTYDLTIFSPLDLQITEQVRLIKKPLLGLCMAYEVNNLDISVQSQFEIVSNLEISSAINFDSQYVSKQFDRQYKYDGRRTFIKYGTDLNIFKYVRNRNEKTYNLICTRGWSRNHGNEIVLEALLELHQQGLDFCCKFIGSKEDQALREEKYSGLLVSNKIVFLESLDSETLSQELVNSDIYISASLSDGTSVSMLEAMACGTPVVVSDFGSNVEIIKNQNNGYTFSNGDSHSLASVLKFVMNCDNSALQQVAWNARVYVEREASWESESKKLKKLIEKLISEGSNVC